MEVLEIVIRRRRLRWFGLVKRRDEEDSLRRVRELVVEGRRPTVRPRKSWRKTIQEDMRKVGEQGEDAWTETDGEASSVVKPPTRGNYDAKWRK